MNKHAASALAALLTACSGTITGGTGESGGSADKDTDPPSIEIDQPARGTMADGNAIRVVGRVTDRQSSIAQVTVNDQVATLNPDGTFTLDLTGADGVNFLQTVATDSAGNVGNDVRAVLIGTLVDQGTPVDGGVVAAINPETMNLLGSMVSDVANSVDFTALATALNPVVDTGGGCNSAKIYVESVEKTSVPVNVSPVAGGIQAGVSVQQVVVHGHVDFNAICIGGSAGWTITASSYDVGGRITPSISGGDITVGFDGLTGTFQNFGLSVGALPGFIVDLFKNQVRDKVASILLDKINQMVPPLANSFLGDFLASSYSLGFLGQTVDMAITPVAMDWSSDGGLISLRTNATIAGVSGASYLSSPRPAPTLADLKSGSQGLRVAVADDAINQIMASFWAAHALDSDFVPEPTNPIKAFFSDADEVTISFLLPPVANADTTTGSVKLYLGDVIVEIKDTDQGLGTLAKFAVSADLDLSTQVGADGRIQVQTGSPHILPQLLEQSSTIILPLDAPKLAAFTEIGIRTTATMIDNMLGSLPIPGLPGAAITSPTIEPRGGYVIMGASVSAAP